MRIFVFGSNLLGVHGAGAAHDAHVAYGAEWGVGEGLTGQAYAIPTKLTPRDRMQLSDVELGVRRFLDFARSRPDLEFYVTRVGCGLAGFTEDQIAPLFRNAPLNCELPMGWRTEETTKGPDFEV